MGLDLAHTFTWTHAIIIFMSPLSVIIMVCKKQADKKQEIMIHCCNSRRFSPYFLHIGWLVVLVRAMLELEEDQTSSSSEP